MSDDKRNDRIGELEAKVKQQAELIRRLESEIRDIATEARGKIGKRNAIIAHRILGWSEYSPSWAPDQKAFGPSARVVQERVSPGHMTSMLIDEAIAAMPDPRGSETDSAQ